MLRIYRPDIRFELERCMLCHNAPCRIERFMRALKFSNLLLAYSIMPLENEIEHALNSCPAGVDIRKICDNLREINPDTECVKGYEKTDLSCDICSVKLQNPFLISSSVVGSNYDMCSRAFDAGWAGVAFKTICLMDISETSPRFSAVRESTGKWLGFKNIEQLSDQSLEKNMACFRKLKENYPEKVIIASIMGRNEEEWAYLAKVMEENGADLIECNFSCPNMEEKGTGSDVGQDCSLVRRYTAAVKKAVKIPVLAKMTPNITDMRESARAALEGGADGICAINTIKSITGVNLETFVAMPEVNGNTMIGGYSGAAVKPIALRFISDMARDPQIKGTHISGMGGIYNWSDALEFILLGASSLQVTTAVMEYGYRIIDDLISGLQIYMNRRHVKSVKDLIGLSIETVVENNEMDRGSRVYPIINRQICNSCGRCYISCRDGGHQALEFDEKTRTVSLIGEKCVGCMLCSLVCPVEAVSQSRRVRRK